MKKYYRGIRDDMEGCLETFMESLSPETYAPGDIIFGELVGDLTFGLVCDGLVLAEAKFYTGGKATNEVYGAHGRGHWIGLEALMDGARLAYRAIAPSRIAVFDKDWFLNEAPADVLRVMVADEADLSLEHRERHMSHRTTLKSRVMVGLLHLRSVSNIPEISITQSDLASLVGASRSNLTPILKELENDGILERSYRNYLIPSDKVLVDYFVKLEGVSDNARKSNPTE